MSKVKIKEETMTDIADAIRAKLNTEQKYKPSEMAEAVLSIGARTSIGGAHIDEYFSSNSSVSPNTFIEFENSYQNSEIECVSDNFFDEAVLNDSNFVVVYNHMSNLKLSLCEIVGNEVSVISTVNLASMDGGLASVVAISEEKVCVVYYKDEETPLLYGIICNISVAEETITKGEEISLGSIGNLFLPKSLCYLGGGKFFVTALDSSNLVVKGCIAEISNMSITVIGTPLITTSGEPLCPPVIERTSISSDSIEAVMVFSSSNGVWAKILTFDSAGNLSQGTNVIVNVAPSSMVGANLDVLYLEEKDSKRYFAVLYDEISYVPPTEGYGTIYGRICTIEGSTLTVGNQTQLSEENTYFPLVQSFKSFFLWKGEYKYELQIGYIEMSNTIRLSRAGIKDTTIEFIEDILLDEDSSSNQFGQIGASRLNKKEGFLLYAAFPSDLKMIDIKCKVAESTNKIDGLTRTKCTSSTKGEAFVLLDNQTGL